MSLFKVVGKRSNRLYVEEHFLFFFLNLERGSRMEDGWTEDHSCLVLEARS